MYLLGKRFLLHYTSRSGTVNGIGLTARQSSLGWSDKTLATTHRR